MPVRCHTFWKTHKARSRVSARPIARRSSQGLRGAFTPRWCADVRRTPMPDQKKLSLTAAIGSRIWRANLETEQAEAQTFQLDFTDVSPIHRAFAPMAREQKFDVSEMA